MRSFALAILALVVVCGVTNAQSIDPRMGTWKLNVAKSKYSPDPHYKSQTMKYEPTDGGFKLAVDTVPPEGQPNHNETVAKADGKDYPVKGGQNVSTRAFTRIDARTWQVVDKLNGKVTLTRKEVVSADGKTLTRIDKGTNAQGQTVNSVVIYDRQ